MLLKILQQSRNGALKSKRQRYLQESRYLRGQKHKNRAFFLKNPTSIYREE